MSENERPAMSEELKPCPLAFHDAVRIARGCLDYGGGHRDEGRHLEIYHHGIQTVINALEASERSGLQELQTLMLWRQGITRATDGVSDEAQNEKGKSVSGESGGSLALVTEGVRLITEKMRSERPTIREYLRSRADGEAKSSFQWEREHPGCAMAAWRSGASYAYRDIEWMLERDGFAPEKGTP